MRGSLLKNVAEISEVVGQLKRLEVLDFRDCEMARSKKYRDYLVVLCESMAELDGKSILATERKFLLGLFSAKSRRKEGKRGP